MFVTAAMTVLCTTSVAFYVRFLATLCRERKPRRGGYWVRLRLGSGEHAGQLRDEAGHYRLFGSFKNFGLRRLHDFFTFG
jgi:hypothetical protein